MKKILLLFSIFAICSCSGKFDEEAVRETTNQFFTNLQSQNWTRVNQIYPEFSKITSYHNFINYAIEEMIYEKGKGICVNIDLEYLTNRLSPPSHYKMKLYFEKNKETKTYYIKDSQSFAVFERDGYLYQYAVKTGCLNELNDVMDIAIAEKIIAATEMYNESYNKIKEDVLSTITITKNRTHIFSDVYGVTWKIENKSPYTLTGLQLECKCPVYYGWTTENLKVKTLKAGESVIVDPTAGESGGRSQTSKLQKVDDAIHNILQNELTYQGDEYEKYLLEKQNPTSAVE